MSAYDERPWLARYGDQPADYEIEFATALDMFRAGVAADPSAAALRYFDGTLTRRELDELSDGLRSTTRWPGRSCRVPLSGWS